MTRREQLGKLFDAEGDNVDVALEVIFGELYPDKEYGKTEPRRVQQLCGDYISRWNRKEGKELSKRIVPGGARRSYRRIAR